MLDRLMSRTSQTQRRLGELRASPTGVLIPTWNIHAPQLSDHSWRSWDCGVNLSNASACTPIEDRTMMARMSVLLAAALLVGGATACSDLTGNNVSAEGAFALETVNGTQVPYTYNDTNGNSIFLQSDFYSLNNDGSYTEFRAWRENGLAQSGTEDGEWSQSSNV